MVSVDNITVQFGGFVLLDRVSFVLNDGEKVALTGRNGAGKSTLLKIIVGQQQPTDGIISISKGTTVCYLPQQMIFSDTCSVKEEVLQVFSHFRAMESELDRLHEEMSERIDYESAAYHDLMVRASDLQETLQMHDMHNFESEAEKTLLGLGFERSDFDRPTSEFSGGWRMRIQLAKILLQSPDVLLLDEPTNHLDIESIIWLEKYLVNHSQALILVSHDRAFLDAVTERTIEIVLGKIYDYKVSYSEYEKLHKERREQQLKAYANQQKMIKDTQDFIERFRYKPTKSNQVQSRIKQLKKLDIIEVDEVDNSRLNLKFPPAPHSGSYPVIMEDVAKNYGDHLVFSNVNMTIPRGDKVAFVGKNGAGKTTLVKCILGEIPYTGELKIGYNVKIGYFAQNMAQLLDGDMTVFDTVDQVATGGIRTRIRDILGAFMFGGDAIDKKVKVLSGGERSRLAMIRLLLEPVNLLILDEPTNHLDMASKDVLKEAIMAFDGTAIIVSHDRDFLNGIVDKVYEFANGQVIEHQGGIYEFLDSKGVTSFRDLELMQLGKSEFNKKSLQGGYKPEINAQSLPTAPIHEFEKHLNKSDMFEASAMSVGKQVYNEQKAFKGRVRKLERQVEDVEAEIAALEKEVSQLEATLAMQAEKDNMRLVQKYMDVKTVLENKMQLWEKLADSLNELNSKRTGYEHQPFE